jgi:hypothetical protein
MALSHKEIELIRLTNRCSQPLAVAMCTFNFIVSNGLGESERIN